MKARVLVFLDNPLGRDTEIILPVAFSIQEYLNAEVRFKFLWDFFYMKLWSPDVILIPNTRGHHMYVEIAAFAKSCEIPVLALDSEGNFPVDGTFDIWGYNKEKEIYQEWITCWSKRTADYWQSIQAVDTNKVVVTGGTGFDRYQFGNLSSQEEILQKIGQGEFKKVVGYAGWAFGKLYSKERENSFKRFFPEDREYAFRWLEEQRIHVRESLRLVIERNSDILFILKKHPKENFEDEPHEGTNEMNELLDYPNVVYLRNEFPIEELINISDLWLAFESTTLFEAWILGKPTILINETTDFPRSSHFKGSIIVHDGNELNNLLTEFYKSGNLDDYHTANIIETRERLIFESIGFADGFNHLRAFYYFQKVIPDKHSKRKIPLNWRHLRLYLLMHIGRFFYSKSIFLKLPKFKKTVYVFENRKMPGFAARQSKVYHEISSFHRKKGLDTSLRLNNWESLRDFVVHKPSFSNGPE